MVSSFKKKIVRNKDHDTNKYSHDDIDHSKASDRKQIISLFKVRVVRLKKKKRERHGHC
jgi:hypothetical protein